jgi:DNA repair protein REV1
MSHADDLQAVSVDEALIDVTTNVEQLQTQASEDRIPTDHAKQLADAIRDQVRKATGCEGNVTITLFSLSTTQFS